MARDYAAQVREGRRAGHDLVPVDGTNAVQCARCGVARVARRREWVGDDLSRPCPEYTANLAPPRNYTEEDAWNTNHGHTPHRTGDRCVCTRCGRGYRSRGLLITGTPLYTVRCTRGKH